MREDAMPGKRIQIEDETWQALRLLAQDSMKDFQELADEAFADLLKKHHRPASFRQALKRSVEPKSRQDAKRRRAR
jgi:hypothetical protein